MSVFTGWWAERAGRAEQDADRMAELLARICVEYDGYLGPRIRDPIRDCLRDWKANRARRYGALPAGHTLEGNLTSGGIQ